MSKCSRCFTKNYTDKSLCNQCLDNPIYNNVPKKSQFTHYNLLCPIGKEDCKYDSAAIAFWYPELYDVMFGDLTPAEVVKKCCKNVKETCAEYEHDEELDILF